MGGEWAMDGMGIEDVVGSRTAPEDVHVLVSGTCDCVALAEGSLQLWLG